MSNSSGLYLTGDRNRFNQWEIEIGEADGDDSIVASNDVVRVKIGAPGRTPLLEVESDAATANGSTTTADNPTTLSLESSDVAFQAGVYDIEVSIWDTSESRIKKVERGVLCLRESMAGEVGA